MAKINLAGASNAAQKGTVFNELQITQSFLPTSVGMDTGGVHLQLGVNLNTDAMAGWRDYVDGIYASLTRFNNNRPNFHPNQLATYLVMTFWADVALAEARRDIMMLNADDATLLSAKTDYFGPGYTERNSWDKTTQIVRFNALAASYAANYSHPTFPMKDILTYLVGNVFSDDNTARMNYIYFHCMNRSLHSTTPDVYQALSAFEKIISTYEANEEMAPYNAEIHALILKVYGDASLIKAPIMNISDRVKYVYDTTLLNALRNAYYVPELVPPAFTIPGTGSSHTTSEGEWYTAQDSADKLVSNAAAVNYMKGPILVYMLQQTSADHTFFDANQMNIALDNQNRLCTGKTYAGEELCASLLFSQEVSFKIDQLDGMVMSSASATTHHGITIAHMWCNAMSQIAYGTWNQYWIRPHMLTLATQAGALDYSIPPTMAAALRAFSQCNAFRAQLSARLGSFNTSNNIFTPGPVVSFALCDPVDEYAVYSNVRLYTTPFSNAYFKAGIDVYKPMLELRTTDGSKPQTTQQNRRPRDNRKGGEQK